MPSPSQLCKDYHCSREADVLLNPLLTDIVIRQIAFERIVGLLETARGLAQISEDSFSVAYSYWEHARDTVYVFSDAEE